MQKITDGPVHSEGLTVIIPTYNGATWLEETIKHIERSLVDANITKVEILVINDGSTDNTKDEVSRISDSARYSVRLVDQSNGGRFIARRTGTNEAKYPYLLFVDTRVFIGEKSLSYVVKKQFEDKSRNVWCSHVRVDTKGNVYARFWEAIAFIAWRKYFKNPKDTSYGITEFDDYPKGTTCFFIKRDVLKEANSWFEKNTMDLKTSNDDTLLIRHIAESNSINVSPDFWCLYHARSKMNQFVKHVYHRGKVFVDGFLRRDGNRFYWPLIGFLILSFIAPVFILLNLNLLPEIIMIGFGLWIVELLLIITAGVPLKDGLSLFILSPVFAVYYGAGIWNSFIRIYILRNTNK